MCQIKSLCSILFYSSRLPSRESDGGLAASVLEVDHAEQREDCARIIFILSSILFSHMNLLNKDLFPSSAAPLLRRSGSHLWTCRPALLLRSCHRHLLLLPLLASCPCPCPRRAWRPGRRRTGPPQAPTARAAGWEGARGTFLNSSPFGLPPGNDGKSPVGDRSEKFRLLGFWKNEVVRRDSRLYDMYSGIFLPLF